MIKLQLTPEQAETIVDALNRFEDELHAQYKSAFVVDQEINLVAALTEIMMGSEFKK